MYKRPTSSHVEPWLTLSKVQQVFPDASLSAPRAGDWFTVHVNEIPRHYIWSRECDAYLEVDRPPSNRNTRERLS